jgi:threonine synthase
MRDAMYYVSTRGQAPQKRFTDILLGGLMEDGGLAMPVKYPTFSRADLDAMRGMDYRQLAFAVLSRFADDIPPDDLRALIDRTYQPEVYCNTVSGSDANEITPLCTLESDLHLLELSNGPTLAFKDMAMQLLGNLFEYALERSGAELNIFGATSGDTGSSAEYAMRGKHGVRVFMLSPHLKMSRFQTAQMFSLQDPNIFNIAVRGVFDDCQDMVKAVSNDLEFKAKYRIGTVNSINWARVSAQVVYYFKGYFAATKQQRRAGQLHRAVGQLRQCLRRPHRPHDGPADPPSGGRHERKRRARRVLPHRHLSAACHGRDAAHHQPFDGYFQGQQFRTFHLRPDRPRCRTGPGDVGRGRSRPPVRSVGFAAVRIGLRRSMDSSRVPSNHAHRLATMRLAHQRWGRAIDTHTADGLKVALELREPGVPMIVLETALARKIRGNRGRGTGQRTGPSRRHGTPRIAAAALRCDGHGRCVHEGLHRAQRCVGPKLVMKGTGRVKSAGPRAVNPDI